MPNNKVYLLAIVLLSLLSASCSSFRSGGSVADTKTEEVVFDDGYKTTSGGELIIDEQSFAGKEKGNVIAGESSEEITQTANDGSRIKVMYDGFGNKTEMRTFSNNPLLKIILLRTDVDGNKKVFVYGKNGEVKTLPENMLDKVLTASPNELAGSAGISEPVKEIPAMTQNYQPPYYAPMKPLPNYQAPVQNNSAPENAAAENADTTETIDENAPPAEKGETQPSVKPSSESPVQTSKIEKKD